MPMRMSCLRLQSFKLLCLYLLLSQAESFQISSHKVASFRRVRPTSIARWQSSSTYSEVVQSEPLLSGPVDQNAASTTSFGEDNLPVELREESDGADEYRRGLLTIGFCTLVFASMSPAMHAALSGSAAPPVLLLNAMVSSVAFLGLVLAGPALESLVEAPSSLQTDLQEKQSDGFFPFLDTPTKAGLELGMWKFLGTVANLYGLSLTTADHGAFLIQLTTLIVPTVQGIMGVPIPDRIKFSIGLALAGVALFTHDSSGVEAMAQAGADYSAQLTGDALCVLAAVFYATYDLRLFGWGKRVTARDLITRKIATQALLSVVLLVSVNFSESLSFMEQTVQGGQPLSLWAVVLWSGFMVNAIVPFLQVGGQQAIGPTRAQTLYASQPLWAAIMSFAFLGETVGPAGLAGGGAFLAALFLAATAEAPDAECGEENCEI